MATEPLRERAEILDALLTRQAEARLRDFVRQAWPLLEPATPFLPNWHIDLLCEYLEAVTAGEIRRLVINMPPRYMKSLLVSVLWPVWEWLQQPATRWLFVSYSESLATKHSVDRRHVIQSAWFRQRFGDRFHLLRHQNEKAEFHNNRRGAMLAIPIGGGATGKGGNRIVVDDPHNPVQAESDAQREQALEFYGTTLTTRLDDKRQGAIIVVMQRLHQRDLTAVCLEQGFTHVCLPVEAEGPETLVFPRSGRVVTRAPGALLWPDREGSDEIAAQQGALGSYAFAGQYQQRPIPRGGGLFKRDWWQFYDVPPRFDQMAQSWDLSFKGGEQHDYVVGLVAGRRGPDIYLVDRYKAHASFTETCEAIRRMAQRYPNCGAVYIEDAANGSAAIDTLRRQVAGVLPVGPHGGKYSRASAAEPRVQAGNVWLPRPTTPDGRPILGRAWVLDFIEQLAQFPYGAHDDDVDAFSQLLIQWQRPMMSAAIRKRIWRIGRDYVPERRIF